MIARVRLQFRFQPKYLQNTGLLELCQFDVRKRFLQTSTFLCLSASNVNILSCNKYRPCRFRTLKGLFCVCFLWRWRIPRTSVSFPRLTEGSLRIGSACCKGQTTVRTGTQPASKKRFCLQSASRIYVSFKKRTIFLLFIRKKPYASVMTIG